MKERRSPVPGLPAPELLHRGLLAWFDAQRRDLPWRRRRSLYGTWISEMMLQQTTVATVVPYWERFLARFPDVQALAAAPEDEVLAHWSGLGYYRRARQLHAAARRVVAERRGELPADHDGWRDLPGIGPYAAGAIASLGLGLRRPAVDANVRRVLTRWLAGPDRPAAPSARFLDEVAAALVPADRPGDWNEALMELGAVLCSPRQPACGQCPVAAQCGAARCGMSPAPAPSAARAAPVAVRAAMLAVFHGDRVWLEAAGGPALACPGAGAPVRDDFTRLHTGLLTLPMSAWYAALPAGGPDGAPVPLAPAWRPWPGAPEASADEAVGRFRHAITRFRLTVEVRVLRTPGGGTFRNPGDPPAGRPAGQWAEPGAADGLHLSQLARKALRLIRTGRG